MHASYCRVLRWDYANFQMCQTAVRINNTSPDQKFHTSFLALHQEKHPTRPIRFLKLFDSQKCINNLWIEKKKEKKKNLFRGYIWKKKHVAGCFHGYLLWDAEIQDDSGVDLICPWILRCAQTHLCSCCVLIAWQSADFEMKNQSQRKASTNIFESN